MIIVVNLIIVAAPITIVVARRDAENHATPLVLNPLGQIDHLRHLGLVFRVNFDHAPKFAIREQVRIDVEGVDNLKNLGDNFHVWVSSIR